MRANKDVLGISHFQTQPYMSAGPSARPLACMCVCVCVSPEEAENYRLLKAVSGGQAVRRD